MADEEHPLSSEELIRRARNATGARPPEETPRGRVEERDTSPPGQGALDDRVESEETDGSDDRRAGERWQAPEETSPAANVSEAEAGGFLSEPGPEGGPAGDGTPRWPPGPIDTQEKPESKPNIWVKLLVFRGWIIGAAAVVFFISRFFGGGTAISSLEVGDCFDEPSLGEEVTDVAVVDCDDPHDFETFAIIDLGATSGPYPGELELSDALAEDCYGRFEMFVGLEWESSIYDFAWYYPTEDAWKSGSKDGLCAIYESDPRTFGTAKRRGTVRGTGR